MVLKTVQSGEPRLQWGWSGGLGSAKQMYNRECEGVTRRLGWSDLSTGKTG